MQYECPLDNLIVTVHIDDTFYNYVAEFIGLDSDEVVEKYDAHEIAEIFVFKIIDKLKKAGIGVYQRYNKKKARFEPLWYYAPWDYRGTKEAEENNEYIEKRVREIFAEALKSGYIVVELLEPGEGDSIFLAIHANSLLKVLIGKLLGDT